MKLPTLSPVAKGALLVLAAGLAFLVASRLAGVSSDALVGLLGAVVGAAIAGAIQFTTSQSEQLDRYRLAAVEKRLQAHQEAFALWAKIIANVHDENTIGAVTNECHDWWTNNCLYLEEDARKAFRHSYICAVNHKDYLKDRSQPETVKANWKDILAAGDALARAVALPPIGELVKEYEKKALGQE